MYRQDHPRLVSNADKGLLQDQAMALSDPKLVPDPVSMAGCKLAGNPSSERKVILLKSTGKTWQHGHRRVGKKLTSIQLGETH